VKYIIYKNNNVQEIDRWATLITGELRDCIFSINMVLLLYISHVCLLYYYLCCHSLANTVVNKDVKFKYFMGRIYDTWSLSEFFFVFCKKKPEHHVDTDVKNP